MLCVYVCFVFDVCSAKLDTISLLAVLGADPHAMCSRDGWTPLSICATLQHHRAAVLHHFISTFHPMAVGVTCY